MSIFVEFLFVDNNNREKEQLFSPYLILLEQISVTVPRKNNFLLKNKGVIV